MKYEPIEDEFQMVALKPACLSGDAFARAAEAAGKRLAP